MSRRVNQPVAVDAADDGAPVAFCWHDRWHSVRQVLKHTREWIGVLDGEPQRDIFVIRSERGVCELHFSSFPSDDAGDDTVDGSGTWLLAAWCD